LGTIFWAEQGRIKNKTNRHVNIPDHKAFLVPL
jgi:hypothetical protein